MKTGACQTETCRRDLPAATNPFPGILLTVLLLSLSILACRNDCERLCREEGEMMDACLDSWERSWADFGYNGKEDYIEGYCLPVMEEQLAGEDVEEVLDGCELLLELLESVDGCEEAEELLW